MTGAVPVPGALREASGTVPLPYADPVRVLERDDELVRLRAALDDARAGQGSGFALTGESGAGKSTLVDAVCDDARALRVFRGHCDPLNTPRPLGPFRDLGLPGLEMVGRDDATLVETCERVYDALRTEPTVLVVEDLHWVDAASVDVLRFLSRRVESMPVLLLMTYRDLEIGPGHRARPLLGDLAVLDGVNAVPLRPLSVDGVAEVLDGTGLDATRVHAVTGGNPFFVTEVAKEPDLPMPVSVRDAVLARTARIPPEDLEVLQLIATAPDHLHDRLLPQLGVDLPTLRRLDETTLLTRTSEGIVFRHELARLAIESTIPPGGASRLHARVLDALEIVDPREPAVLTHHAVLARDARRAAAYAQQAAAEAIRTGSHTEAAAFFQTALENLDGATAGERAGLLLQLAHQQYMTSRLTEAIGNVRATFPLWVEAGDEAGLAAAHGAVAIYEYYSARRRQAEDHLDQAAEIATRAGSVLTFGHARATRAFLATLRSDLGLSHDCLLQAQAANAEHHEAFLALRGEVIENVTSLAGGDTEARSRLFGHVESARSLGFDELASTVYSQIVNLDAEHGRYRQAERLLEESLPFAAERDIPICSHYQTGVRTRLQFVKGHWSAALEDAASVLDEEGMPIATFWPFVVCALVPLRRGDAVPRGALEEAWRLSEQLDEPARRMAMLAALAEQAWMTNDMDSRVSELAVAQLPVLASAAGAGWSAGHLAVWLRRLGLPVDVPPLVAEPFRLALDGKHAEAASWWRMAGDPFAEAMAWSDSAAVDDRVRGIQLLDRLGAVGTADRLRVVLRKEGHPAVPQRPRTSTRGNPAGLTNRQLEVARLVARGLSNNEIAGRLYISPKTADHHVSAILAKLDLPSRRAVALQAAELGLD